MNIVITGNAVDGMQFFGPFEDVFEAMAWTDGLGSTVDYLITNLEAPE